LAGIIAPTRELTVESVEMILKLGNSTPIVTKDVGCSKSAVSNEKHTGHTGVRPEN